MAVIDLFIDFNLGWVCKGLVATAWVVYSLLRFLVWIEQKFEGVHKICRHDWNSQTTPVWQFSQRKCSPDFSVCRFLEDLNFYLFTPAFITNFKSGWPWKGQYHEFCPKVLCASDKNGVTWLMSRPPLLSTHFFQKLFLLCIWTLTMH